MFSRGLNQMAKAATRYAYFGVPAPIQNRSALFDAKKAFHTSLSTFEEDPSKVRRIRFPENVESELAALVNTLPNPLEEPTHVGNEMAKAFENLLPSHILAELKEMGSTNNPGIVLIDGFPTGTVPSGRDGEGIQERSAREGPLSNAAMLGITTLMGKTWHSHPNEQGGRIIHNIAPVAGLEKTQSSKGRDPFYLHTENPFEHNPPHFLMLVGMEGDPTAKTSYLPVKNVLGRLSDSAIENMQKDEFLIKSGAGVDGVVRGRFRLLDSVTSPSMDFMRLYQSHERLEGTTPESKKTLEELGNVFAQIEKEGEIEAVGLQPKQALIFANACGPKLTNSIVKNVENSVMHGKIGHTDNPFRWIKRQFLIDQTNEQQSSHANSELVEGDSVNVPDRVGNSIAQSQGKSRG